jgi:signal peptidase I
MSATTPTPDPAPAGAAPKVADAPPLETFFKGNRALAAGTLFLLLEAVPALGLVLALREGGGVWLGASMLLMIGAFLPPAGVVLGQRWGYLLGQYVVWGSLGGVVLRALQFGFTPVYLGPAVLLGVLLVAVSAPRSAGDSRRAEKKPESYGVWIKENIEAIVIAFIMALVIRCFCIEVFKIPSSSMEPTLLGDIAPGAPTHPREDCTFRDYHVSPGGDRIMVTKYFYAFSPVERYDVLVFKFPLNQAKNFIKRVVGLPDEYIKIHRGNLYVSKEENGVYEIARRTLRTQDSLWIDPARGPGGYFAKKDQFEGSWEAKPLGDAKKRAHYDVLDGELQTKEDGGERSVQFLYHHKDYNCRYLDDNDGRGTPVDDVRVSFEAEITSPKGQLFAEVVNAYGRFEVTLDTDGAGWLNHYKPDRLGGVGGQPGEKAPLKDVQLAMDKSYKIELAIFDGTAYVLINGGERAKLTFITTMEKEKLLENDAPDRRIAFGSRGLTFKAKNLAVGRDIFYKGRNERDKGLREDEAFHIEKGKYLMMGDNVANSHDSRAWIQRTFVLKDGRQIVCENQQVNEGMSKFGRHLQ